MQEKYEIIRVKDYGVIVDKTAVDHLKRSGDFVLRTIDNRVCQNNEIVNWHGTKIILSVGKKLGDLPFVPLPNNYNSALKKFEDLLKEESVHSVAATNQVIGFAYGYQAKESQELDLHALLANFYFSATNGGICDHKVIEEYLKPVLNSQPFPTAVILEVDSTETSGVKTKQLFITYPELNEIEPVKFIYSTQSADEDCKHFNTYGYDQVHDKCIDCGVLLR